MKEENGAGSTCANVKYDLPEVVLASKCSVNVVSRRLGPECYFRPTGFIIPDDVAEDLLVTDIKVGSNSQFYSAGAVPAGLFAESTPEALTSMDHLDPGLSLMLSLTNAGDRAVNFRGQVRGVATHVAEDLPSLGDIPFVMGLGCLLVSGKGKATINVEPQIDAAPYRLYVPRRVLESFEVESFTSEIYLNAKAASRVEASLLCRESLVSGGLVKLEPESVVMAQTFFAITVVNRTEEPKNFFGAVLATRAVENAGAGLHSI